MQNCLNEDDNIDVDYIYASPKDDKDFGADKDKDLNNKETLSFGISRLLKQSAIKTRPPFLIHKSVSEELDRNGPGVEISENNINAPPHPSGSCMPTFSWINSHLLKSAISSK